MSNILTARDLVVGRMNRRDDDATSLVEIDNAMSANYAVLRDSIVPSLLAISTTFDLLFNLKRFLKFLAR